MAARFPWMARGIAVVLLASSFASAESPRASDTKPLSDRERAALGLPVYHPESKRYFALMEVRGIGGDTQWHNVAKQAQMHVYKEKRGRLAVVNSKSIHDFLTNTFQLKRGQFAWIGLRFHCRIQKLEWSDGSVVTVDSFSAWDANWKQDVYFCSEVNDPNDWAPVAYSPTTRRWIAKGRGKGYDWYFIEYPTGHP